MITADVKDTNEAAWDEGTLGLSAEHAVPAPAELEQEVDEALALQLISIRLPRKLIDDLKLIAQKEGIGYQPMIRRVLLRFAHAEFRSMARDNLVSELNSCDDGDRVAAVG
ncbi:BrnA antitoxin family protein [Stenotrophomonas sp. MMGLT7]|uniref:BrnA antitoxin family protein n=1 Tax=Stenotrophomonas sp. MMGLT7 TaxID=2901227 RepID=UPI001E2ECF8D|nr:BrnA antitoxin family protein [Stenotrophomonas sp. MMGLT7]